MVTDGRTLVRWYSREGTHMETPLELSHQPQAMGEISWGDPNLVIKMSFCREGMKPDSHVYQIWCVWSTNFLCPQT